MLLDLVRDLARAGKHVLLEKPVEANSARAKELVAACERAGVTLAMVLQHRFRDASLALTRRIADGALSYGAAIAYYTIFALAPVLLIVVAVAGLAFGQDAAQGAIVAQLTGLMGRQSAEAH